MNAKNTWREKVGLAEMLKGGVIMDVVNPDQAKIAEDAGAVAVMALERVPADIRRDGGVARMSDPEMILGIKEAVSMIPLMMDKARPAAMRAPVLVLAEAMDWATAWFDMIISLACVFTDRCTYDSKQASLCNRLFR